MAGMDSTFSAAGQGQSVSVNLRDTQFGNPSGDVVDNSEGNNPVNGNDGETRIEGRDVSRATITKSPQWKTGTDPLWPNS